MEEQQNVQSAGYFETQPAHPHNNESLMVSEKAFALALPLVLFFAGFEAWGAYYFNSLALWGDAGHMLSDALTLAVAWLAQRYALAGPSMRHSYGFGRLEIVAACFNGLVMCVVVIAILWEAWLRLNVTETTTNGWGVIAISSLGLLVNIGVFWLFHRYSAKTFNVRAVLLHVGGDILGSLTALTTGICIVLWQWYILDPILSAFICILISISAFRLLHEAIHVLMEGVPPHLNLQEIGGSIASIPGIRQVHDLHVWALSSGTVALTVHVVLHELSEWPKLHTAIKQLLNTQFAIWHTTIQPEWHPDLSETELLHSHQHQEEKT